ncbi:MAG TPA: DUF5615 family PIN-like protein [Gallionella sp.]|nr:DUF5615 family PIN-like protein [Gallionella sp.]
MSIALLANENFPAPAICKLRAAGVDVVAVSEAMPSVSDKEVWNMRDESSGGSLLLIVTMAI